MTPGIYITNGQEKRYIATLDDMTMGSEETNLEIANDIFHFVRDTTVDFVMDMDSDESVKKVAIFIVDG